MCLIRASPLLPSLPHSFCFWHMHAHSSHLLLHSCWIINFWAGWCDSNTHTHTHAQTLPWDWIDTPLCSAEGGIDIISGLRPNTLLSFRKREEVRRGLEHGERERNRGTTHFQDTNWPVDSAFHVFICATCMCLLKVEELRTSLAVKPHMVANHRCDFPL